MPQVVLVWHNATVQLLIWILWSEHILIHIKTGFPSDFRGWNSQFMSHILSHLIMFELNLNLYDFFFLGVEGCDPSHIPTNYYIIYICVCRSVNIYWPSTLRWWCPPSPLGGWCPLCGLWSEWSCPPTGWTCGETCKSHSTSSKQVAQESLNQLW